MSKREAILDAATQLFASKGFRETSTTDLAKMTGSAEGTLFYHFESKEKLFIEVLREVREDLEQEFEVFVTSRQWPSGLEMLEAVICFYLQLAAKNESLFLLLHRHYAYELAGVNEPCRRHLEAIYDRFVKVFEHAILRGQEDKSMGHVPVHRTAMLVFMMVDGLVRFRTFHLYDSGSLYAELIAGCRRLVAAPEVGGEP